MGNFINDRTFTRFFHHKDDFGIINIGYDDFCQADIRFSG